MTTSNNYGGRRYILRVFKDSIGEKTVMIIKLHNDHAKNTILENVIGIMDN